MGRIREYAKELYAEFIETLEKDRGYSMPEFNSLLDQFLKDHTIDPVQDCLIYDAVYDCKDDQLVEDIGEEGTVPEGTYPEGL